MAGNVALAARRLLSLAVINELMAVEPSCTACEEYSLFCPCCFGSSLLSFSMSNSFPIAMEWLELFWLPFELTESIGDSLERSWDSGVGEHDLVISCRSADTCFDGWC